VFKTLYKGKVEHAQNWIVNAFNKTTFLQCSRL